jgi:hypothetical protein
MLLSPHHHQHCANYKIHVTCNHFLLLSHLPPPATASYQHISAIIRGALQNPICANVLVGQCERASTKQAIGIF